MTDNGADSIPDLQRENRKLRKKLQRVESKIQTLEMLQGQNSNLMRTLVSDLDAEKAESERLLLNILPEPIAQRLKTESGVIADRFESVTVLFADIVGFTPLSESLSPEEMVQWLNEVYSAFDELVIKHGVEKIRTIGDGYMVAAGVPFEREDHASAVARLALDMKAYFATIPAIHGHQPNFRIGISSGPVVGGVIGTLKFQYDIWGDVVNIAARMESHGVPSRIQISADTWGLISSGFTFESRGSIDIKGKGRMETWFLTGSRT
jgi:adenylate cyclase